MKLSLTSIEFIVIILLGFGVYLTTVARFPVNYADSNELITAAWVKGVAHPPGYPLYIFFLHHWMKLPFLSPAFAANVSSALLQSFCLGFFHIACVEMIKIIYRVKNISLSQHLVCLTGTLTLGFSYLFWLQATIAEVFPLNNLFASLILLFIFKWLGEDKNNTTFHTKYLYILAFLFGLATSHHQTILFLLPGLLAVIFLKVNKQYLPKMSLILSLVIFFISFLLPFSLLWHFSNSDASFSWYFEPTAKGLWKMISRQLYTTDGSAIETFVREINLYHSFYSFVEYVKHTASYVTVFGLFLGFVGLFSVWRKNRKIFIFLFLSFLITGPFLVAYLKFPFPTISDSGYYWGTALRLRMFLLNQLVLALLIVSGLAHLVWKFANGSKAVLVFSFILPTYLVFSTFPVVNARDSNSDFILYNQILTNLPPSSVLIVDSDEVFGLLYQHIVERVRTDVAIVPATTQMRWKYLYANNIQLFNYEDRTQQLADIVSWNLFKDKRVFLFPPNFELLDYLGVEANPFYLIPSGYTVEISKIPRTIEAYNYGLSKQLSEIEFDQRDLWSKGGKGNLSFIHTLIGYFLIRGQNTQTAKIHFELAHSLAQLQHNKASIETIRKADIGGSLYLQVPPPTFEEYVTFAQTAISSGDLFTANLYARKATFLDPVNPQARHLLSEIYAKQGDLSLSQKEFYHANLLTTQ